MSKEPKKGEECCEKCLGSYGFGKDNWGCIEKGCNCHTQKPDRECNCGYAQSKAHYHSPNCNIYYKPAAPSQSIEEECACEDRTRYVHHSKTECYTTQDHCEKCKTELSPQKNTNGWESQFDEKFPWRIYGVAGEPKTEFIEAKNKPENIKSFVRFLLQNRNKEVIEMIEKMKKEQWKTDELNSQRHSGRTEGYNQALDDIILALKSNE